MGDRLGIPGVVDIFFFKLSCFEKKNRGRAETRLVVLLVPSGSVTLIAEIEPITCTSRLIVTSNVA